MGKVPDGFHTVTPYIVVSGGTEALKHYEEALGAQTLHTMMMPGTDKVMHSCFQVGTSKVFLCDENPQMVAPKDGQGGSHFYLYFDDVDKAHAQAVAAGMTETQAPTDMFWGDRMSGVACKYGHHWNLASHVKDVSPEEMAEAMKQMAG